MRQLRDIHKAVQVSANAAERIERSLASAVLRGDYPPGSRLPTLRELAGRFGANVATVQRAIARLEMSGLVTARQGSGIRVNAADTHADLALVPARIEALSHDPARAVAVLGDFLEVRRVLAARLIVRHRAELERNASALAAAATRLAGVPTNDVQALVDADIAFARAVLVIAGNSIALAVLNTAARVLREVPAVAEAMYSDPRLNVRSMTEILAAFGDHTDDGPLGDVVEASIQRVDEHTLARFEALLIADHAEAP